MIHLVICLFMCVTEHVYICMYGDIAVGDLVIVGLKCRPYLETSYTIIVFALNANIL